MSARRMSVALLAIVIAAAAIVFAPVQLLSQSNGFGNDFLCGSQPTPEEAARYFETLGQGAPQGPSATTAPPYCVPIVAHIVRQSNGSGGMSLSQYQQALDDSNLLFQNTGIVFYTLGIDYIDDDFYYFNITTIGDINALRGENVVNAAINVYFTPNLPGLCGISSFTFSSVQGIAMANGCSGTPSFPSVLAHEIGHYVDLFHTHETAFGTEFVDGTNCTGAGDLICDTPADPGLGFSNVSTPSCTYFGSETDPKGDPYAPDPSQIMSYAPSICADTFSPTSESNAVSTLLGPRSSLLSRGCGAIAPPTLTLVDPGDAFIDQTLEVLLVGSNFGIFTTVDFGDDIVVNSQDTLSTNDSLVVNITIDPVAVPGLRDVTVDNAFSPVTLPNAFEVLGTPAHYVSPLGGDVYPYARPADAAITLSDAVAAAADGDSVKVDTTTITNVSFMLDRSVALSGGWTDNFTARDLANKKTTLTLFGNLLLNAAGGTMALDGFLFEDGRGAFDVGPIGGYYGGAMRIFSTTASITNCEFRNNDAMNGFNFGGGGAIYSFDSDITIADCHFHNNNATRGGAVYLYQCSGAINDCVIENNTLNIGPAGQPEGGGVALHDCGTVTFTDNTFDGNTGGRDGGAMWIENSSSVTVTGGNMSNHSVTFGGGAVRSNATALTLDGVTLSQNSSALFGGGVSNDTGALTVTECTLDGNSGLLGGALYHNNADAHIRHNTFTGNTATNIGGAAYVGTASNGEVQGNTCNLNSCATGVGGLALVSSPIAVFNNIVTNTTGIGLQCSGPAPTASYNLVWNSSTSDWDGCGPGTGSVSMDPLFVNAGVGDFQLAVNSPAIDSGDPAPAYDDPDGSRGDMGRFGSHTFTMQQPEYTKNLVTTLSGGETNLYWDPNPEGNIDYYAIYCDTIPGFKPGASSFVTTSPDTTENLGAPSDTTYYLVCAVNTSGYAGGYSNEVASEPDPASSVGGGNTPLVTQLEQNVPNPFNPSTTIAFSLAEASHVRLTIYDVAGRTVRTLVNSAHTPSQYRVTWDGTSDNGARVASGIYFYRLNAGAYTQTKKMVLLK